MGKKLFTNCHIVDVIGKTVTEGSVLVEDGDTPETLQRRVMEQAEWELLPKAVSLFCEGRLSVDGSRVRIL